MDWKEANVRINGELTTVAEAMTIRVAVISFLAQLSTDGSGADEAAIEMCTGYQDTCRSILSKLALEPTWMTE